MIQRIRNRVLFSALLITLSATAVTAQQSDYDIQRNFQQELSELTAEIEDARELGELTELGSRVDQLENRYSEHEELINAALYPQTFRVLIGNVRDQLTQSLSSVEVVEELSTRIDELSTEVSGYREQIETINQETSQLQSRLQQSEVNEQNQAALLQEYRQNIEERNQFVSQFLEQLMSRYQNITPSDQQEISESSERLAENPLNVLESILNEYTSIAGEPIGLGATDYASMRAQYIYFEDVWDRIGDSLARTFAGENASAAKSSIDAQLSGWIDAIDNQLWESLSEAFENNGIVLEEFSNEMEFYNALYGYVDDHTVASEQTNSEEDYNTYTNFNDYWNNTVKAEWGSLLIEANILSPDQIAAIDLKLGEWSNTAAPESNMMLILLIVSIVIIIGLIVVMFMKRD